MVTALEWCIEQNVSILVGDFNILMNDLGLNPIDPLAVAFMNIANGKPIDHSKLISCDMYTGFGDDKKLRPFSEEAKTEALNTYIEYWLPIFKKVATTFKFNVPDFITNFPSDGERGFSGILFAAFTDNTDIKISKTEFNAFDTSDDSTRGPSDTRPSDTRPSDHTVIKVTL